ncbi:MAG: HlyC/CorC family transporter [Lachnospiraceae bacterium]|nr:HlyC/CorC family transporter [Lachnospiraceae bacterium]
MEDGGPTASIMLLLAVLLIEFLFYGFGAALQKYSYGALKEEEENGKKSSRNQKLLTIQDMPSRYINTMQVITTTCNIIIGIVCFPRLYRSLCQMTQRLISGGDALLEVSAFSIFLLLLTGLILLFLVLTIGVLVPKKTAERHAQAWVNLLVEPIYGIMLILRPFTGFVTIISNMILRLFGVNPNQNMADVTEEEIISMVNEGHEQGVLQASEAQMITNIFEFSDKEAKDIMTHRSNIVAIDGMTTLRECVNFMLNTGTNSRYPVYIDNIDHIIGIIHLKDAFQFLEKGNQEHKPIKNIRNLIREARFVPETRKIDSLFHSMQALKSHMVIIIDEYGQTSGLVAMEDILEEIVGNILDEYDQDEILFEQKGQDQYEIDGLTPLEELEDLLHIVFKQQEFETLNGLMVSRLEHIPGKNEQFDMDYEGYNFKVLAVENKVIRKVLVTKKKQLNETK